MPKRGAIPKAFLLRRLHSLTGLWLALFLVEHLLTNSQAALLIGEDGVGFIHGVNWIKSLPYLPVIEIFLLGVPIIVHMMWGVVYLRTGKLNSYRSDGTTPSLSEYPRNRAYSWQRMTSWILLFALIGHIVHMRFIEYPGSAQKGSEHYYTVRLSQDAGLYTLAARLDFDLYNQDQIQLEKEQLPSGKASRSKLTEFFFSLAGLYQKEQKELLAKQKQMQNQEWINALEKRPLRKGEVVAVTKDFGTAELLMVRDTFKMPVMIVLYTIFVLAACFHAYNGLWTFLITWGITLTKASQRMMLKATTGLMVLIAFFGLAAIWGTYWINLRY